MGTSLSGMFAEILLEVSLAPSDAVQESFYFITSGTPQFP